MLLCCFFKAQSPLGRCQRSFKNIVFTVGHISSNPSLICHIITTNKLSILILDAKLTWYIRNQNISILSSWQTWSSDLITSGCKIPYSRAWRSSCRCWSPQAWSSQRGPWACAPSWQGGAQSPPRRPARAHNLCPTGPRSCVPWAARPVSLASITSALLTSYLPVTEFLSKNVPL